MTRKRFIKLVMSCGYPRNEAQKAARHYNNRGLSYKSAFTLFVFRQGAKASINGFRDGMSVLNENLVKTIRSFVNLTKAMLSIELLKERESNGAN